MTRFIVLSDRSGNWRRPAVPLSGTVEMTFPDQPAEPVVEMIDLSPAQARELVQDEKFLAMARAVPTRIVEPEPLDELREEDIVPGWGLDAIGALRTRCTGKGARVALLDTGIETAHPAFAGLTCITRDFVGTGIEDVNGHGTHMAGTILGRDVGGTRIGVARGIQTLHLGKAIADNGRGSSESFLEAVLWALQEKVDVIAFALSFDLATHIEQLLAEGYPTTLATESAVHAYRGNLRIFETLLTMYASSGPMPLVLGAVGNDSRRVIAPEFETGPGSPAAARGVLAIGALGQGDDRLVRASFSNAGAALSAPGVGILSASIDGGLRAQNGSSMAMAHAAGVAALWAQDLRRRDLPVAANSLAARLFENASQAGLAAGGYLLDFGRGMVQAPTGG